MSLSQAPVFVTNIFVLFCNYGLSASVCRPVHEGETLELTCSGATNGPEKIVHWKQRIGNYGQETNLIDCYSHADSSKCVTPATHTFAATIESSGANFSSSLIISDISVDLNGYIFTCGVFDLHHTTHLYSCEVNVYRRPEGVNCDVLPVRGADKEILVRCYAKVIYPMMSCEVDESEANSTLSSVKYSKNCSHNKAITSNFAGGSMNCWHSCSLKFYISGQLFPQVHIQIATLVDGIVHPNTLVKQRVGSVNITRLPMLPTVSTLPVSINLCSKVTEKTVTAHAKYLSVDTRFIWCLSYEDGSEMLKDDMVPLQKTTTAKSKLDLSVLSFTRIKEMRNSKIICGVSPVNHTSFSCGAVVKRGMRSDDFRPGSKDKNERGTGKDGTDENYNDNADGLWHVKSQIEVRWPPVEAPRLMDSKGDLRDGILHLMESERTKVKCRVEGGQPYVRRTSVTCTSKYHTILLTNTSSVSEVEFTLEGKSLYDEAQCVCEADHVTGCFDLVSRISLVVASNSTQLQLKGTSDKVSLPILLIVVLVVFVGVIAAVINYFYRNWDKFGIYSKPPRGTARNVEINELIETKNETPMSSQDAQGYEIVKESNT